jgi:hypothetical protein
MPLMFGKTPAVPDAVKLKFATYFDATELPKPPPVYGVANHSLVNTWPMFGNTTYGDCVWAGAAHETMLWVREGGSRVLFTDSTVLSDYSAATGFIPSQPATDQGTNMAEAAAYRQKTGIVDASGLRHKVGPYVALEAGNLQQVTLASYLFSVAAIGVLVPQSAVKQFESAQPWSVVSTNTKIVGGHYVPVVGRNSSGHYIVVTWGRLQAAEPAWIERYMDEGLAYLSLERLRNGISPLGFDEGRLEQDLNNIHLALNDNGSVVAA